MDTTARVLFVVLAVIFAGSAIAALARASAIVTLLDELGVGPRLFLLIAVLELAAVAGLLAGLVVVPLGVAAAVGLVLLMVGAVGYHVRARDYAGAVPAAVLAALAAVTAAVGVAAAG